jgi:hypothetical protein
MEFQFERVRYKNKYYAIFRLKYKNINLPVVLDWTDVRLIKNLKKKWRCNNSGFISCSHTYKTVEKEVFMHEIIMALKQKDFDMGSLYSPIIHINRIGLDNRRENLMYDTIDKDTNKNIKKKKRTITLPKSSHIDPDEIPTYVWYMKPNDSHGERFMVDVGDVKWKTTSSKKLGLRYKLEEAKLFLRELKKNRPDLFEDYSMNGDYTKDGKLLTDSYYNIIHKANYTHISRYIPGNKTSELLRPGKQNAKEKVLLSQLRDKDNLLQKGGQRRRVISNLPKNSGLTSNDLPKHCYYRPEYKNRGDQFIITGHPNQNSTVWQSTSSKKINVREKYDQMINHLTSIELKYENNLSNSDLDSSYYSEESMDF